MLLSEKKKMRKSPLFNVSVTCFYWKCHHTPLSLSGCEHSHAPWCPLAPTWLQSARARVEHYTHRESASSFSFSVCMCECESDFSLSDLYSLLPAIASSLTQPPDVLLCTPTPWCYISRLVWTACVLSDRSEMMIWQCHTAADMLWYCACILSLLRMNSD